eukprot:scaffold257229_cov24-Prasinocladus_malaysianus.AAC.1
MGCCCQAAAWGGQKGHCGRQDAHHPHMADDRARRAHTGVRVQGPGMEAGPSGGRPLRTRGMPELVGCVSE